MPQKLIEVCYWCGLPSPQEKLKSFQDTQFKRFTFPEIQVPNKKDLFMYVQFWFEWQISPYKIMVDIESMDDQGQKIPTKQY